MARLLSESGSGRKCHTVFTRVQIVIENIEQVRLMLKSLASVSIIYDISYEKQQT